MLSSSGRASKLATLLAILLSLGTPSVASVPTSAHFAASNPATSSTGKSKVGFGSAPFLGMSRLELDAALKTVHSIQGMLERGPSSMNRSFFDSLDAAFKDYDQTGNARVLLERLTRIQATFGAESQLSASLSPGPLQQKALAELIRRVDQLEGETASSDWDSERGEPISPDQWAKIRQVLSTWSVRCVGLAAPFVSACGDGTAHLQWTTTRGDRGILEVGRNSLWWSFLPADGKDDTVSELTGMDEVFPKMRALFHVA
jgi:hypothetical protein